MFPINRIPWFSQLHLHAPLSWSAVCGLSSSSSSGFGISQSSSHRSASYHGCTTQLQLSVRHSACHQESELLPTVSPCTSNISQPAQQPNTPEPLWSAPQVAPSVLQNHPTQVQQQQRVTFSQPVATRFIVGSSTRCVSMHVPGSQSSFATSWLMNPLSSQYCVFHTRGFAKLSTSALSSTPTNPSQRSSSLLKTRITSATAAAVPSQLSPHAAPITERTLVAAESVDPADLDNPAVMHSEQTIPPTSPAPEVKKKGPRNSSRFASLTRYPPGSDRWQHWTTELSLVPGIAPEDATTMLRKNPNLLENSPQDAGYRITDMLNLLARETGLPHAELLLLMYEHPLTATLQVREVGAVLVWLGVVLGCKVTDKGQLIQKAPRLLSLGTVELEQRLEVLLALGLAREKASQSIIWAPVLLLLPSEKITESVQGLVREFSCSEAYVLQQVPYVLTRSLARIRGRAAFLRLLGVKEVSIHNTESGDPDEVFAALAVRGYTKRSGKELEDLCQQIRKMPGFGRAITAAKMQGGVETPLQCLQAHRCVWEAGEAAAEVAAVAAVKARRKKIAGAAVADDYSF